MRQHTGAASSTFKDPLVGTRICRLSNNQRMWHVPSYSLKDTCHLGSFLTPYEDGGEGLAKESNQNRWFLGP